MKTQGERPKLHWESSAPSHTYYPNQFAPASPVATNRPTASQHAEWSQLVGAKVEIRYKGRVLRTGFVDDAMPDSSALWLAADADGPRQIYEESQGHQVWIAPQELPGELHYRMTVNQLFGASPRGVQTQLL